MSEHPTPDGEPTRGRSTNPAEPENTANPAGSGNAENAENTGNAENGENRENTANSGFRHLSAPPRLAPAMARGALGAPRKRGPYTQARLPRQGLVLSRAQTDPARLHAYARVCGHDGSAAAAVDATLPPAYPHILGFPLAMRLMSDPGFPFPLPGLVHTAIHVVQERPLLTTDRPDIEVSAGELAPHRRGSQFTVTTRARLHGEVVWHSRSTYLCRHRTSHTGAEDGTAERAAARQEPEPLPDTTTLTTWDLPADLGRRYGAASGDRNPIHLHPLTAKLFGFPRHIAHGMWTFARCLAELDNRGEQRWDGRFTAEAEFKAPVPLPCAVTFDHRPADRHPAPPHGQEGDTPDGRGEADGPRDIDGPGDIDAPREADERRGTERVTEPGQSAAVTFEVRDSKGRKPHLSGRASSEPPPSGSPARPS